MANKNRYYSRSEILHNKTDKKSRMYIILSLIFGILLIALVIGSAYLVFKFYLSHNASQDQKKQGAKSHLPKTHKVAVDVNSYAFSQGYMKSPNTEGYKGFELGQKQATVEKKYGKPEKSLKVDHITVEQYGNMGISYNKENIVNHVFVLPDHMSKSVFTNFHNAPDEIKDGFWYYDANKYNGFTIKVYTSKEEIKAIENIPQQ